MDGRRPSILSPLHHPRIPRHKKRVVATGMGEDVRGESQGWARPAPASHDLVTILVHNSSKIGGVPLAGGCGRGVAIEFKAVRLAAMRMCE